MCNSYQVAHKIHWHTTSLAIPLGAVIAMAPGCSYFKTMTTVYIASIMLVLCVASYGQLASKSVGMFAAQHNSIIIMIVKSDTLLVVFCIFSSL